ncbi:50S ribosomal protein L16 [Candidatus Woesearchaeota archaeon]|nr:50S ribosomal protein L16 [Candidatus Woesearchaeota archaeon]MBW2993887.1 50S ribosomal protein L16 [Candidatus Woesearchaeota archaeon]
MARLRKAVAYRKLERPYTRFSKYKKQRFVRAKPVCRVVRFDMGNATKEFETSLHLVVRSDLQIRDNALEAARQTCNRALEKVLGKSGYHLKVRVYPHHVLRENPLAAGAGADRMSTGMAHSFGKVIGIAARLKKGQAVFSTRINKKDLTLGKTALTKASRKLPCKCTILQGQKVAY